MTTILTLILTSLSVKAAPTIRITTDAPANKIGVGETFHISIEANNCPGRLDIDRLPPGCKVVYKSSSSTTSSSTINGKVTQDHTTALILTCKGETPGKYSFGPVSINNIYSNILNYQIISGSTRNNNKDNNNPPDNHSLNAGDPQSGPMFIGKGNEEMFLKASVNKTTAYQQEAIEYTVKLYTTYHTIKFLGAAAAPKFDGFVVDESQDISKSFIFEDYNGKTYQTAIIAKYIIFPQKSGELKISGNTYTISTDKEQYYHDPYFATMTVRTPIQLNVTPNDLVVYVKALPSPVPSDFIGGVGKFSIKSDMPNKSITTNAAGSVVYTIEGEGNIKYLKLPEISSYFPSSIEVYTPDISVKADVVSTTVKGISRFDFSFVPKEAGNFTIPSLTFSYFNPETEEYKQLKTDDFKIEVTKGKISDKSQQALRFNPDLLPSEKNFNRQRDLYIYTLLYWLWYAVPLVIFFISLIWYRKYKKDHEDMVMLRSKKANKMAMRRLAKAYKSLKAKKEEEFYDNMLKALWGYIGEKLKMSTSKLTRSNVGYEFTKHNVKEEIFMPIINLIDECEYAKYTPVSRESNMKILYSDALDSLTKVDKEYTVKTKVNKKRISDEEDGME